MLAHLEPSADITGGPWFSENELDTEFIEEMCKICYRYVLSKSAPSIPGQIVPANRASYPDLEQIFRFVKDSRVTLAELTREDVSMLLDRLAFDGKVEKIISMKTLPSQIVSDDEDDNVYVYKTVNSVEPESCMGTIPCGTCPVYQQCSDYGPVTPAKCTYYTQWLNSSF
jgi:DNA-directed RNA polymerase III subunit RPC6